MHVDDTHRRIAEQLGIAAEQVRDLEERKGVRPESLPYLKEGQLERMLLRLQLGDLPSERDAFRRKQEQNEQGYIPPQGLANALYQLDSLRMRNERGLPRGVAGVPTGAVVQQAEDLMGGALAGLAPGSAGWQSLGPGNVGGRTRSIVVHPQDPMTMWAGSVGGGIWRTVNGGTSWQPVDDFMANLAVTSIAIDPSDPTCLYAGTGEGFNNLDALRGAGIFMTTQGRPWRQLAATNIDDMRFITRVAVSANGAIVLAATSRGMYRSGDAARTAWPRVLDAPVADVDFHPTDSRLAVAGSLRDGQAYVTTDGGVSWHVATHNGVWSGRVEVTYALADPTIVYASVDINGGEIWRSDDGGATYTKRRSEFSVNVPARYLGGQGWYDNVIWAGDSNDAGFVVVGGIDLWRSTDAGNTLVQITDWMESTSVHSDHHCVVSAPAGGAGLRVLLGNDGGVYSADDIRTSGTDTAKSNGYTDLVNTYEVTQFYAVAGNPNTGVIIGGTQDNGTIRFDPGTGPQQWTKMMGGDGGWCAADPIRPDIFYGEYVWLNIHRSTDNGFSSDYISGRFYNRAVAPNRWDYKPAPFTIEDARRGKNGALFIAPFVLDPNKADTILAGGQSLWRTNDARTPNTNFSGPAWNAMKPPAPALQPQFISAIAVARGSSDTIWIGYDHGRVEKTTNGTKKSPTWTVIAASLPARYCTSIVISQSDRKVVYVTFGGYSRGNVWKTPDGGISWIDLGAGLPEAPVRALAIHPRHDHFLYVGTEVGVFASEDGGATWSPTNEGPTNCSVDDLIWMNEVLICATHGRGVFSIDLSGV